MNVIVERTSMGKRECDVIVGVEGWKIEGDELVFIRRLELPGYRFLLTDKEHLFFAVYDD